MYVAFWIFIAAFEDLRARQDVVTFSCRVTYPILYRIRFERQRRSMQLVSLWLRCRGCWARFVRYSERIAKIAVVNERMIVEA